MSESSPLYWAFVSYCNRDRVAARWLQRALETYAVPHHLIGRATPVGPAPKWLRPIFRDSTELPANSNLRSTLETALSRSAFLIVVCSPDAAKSHWVNEEIRNFRAQHGPERILSVIVGGTIHGVAQDCFPAALTDIASAGGAHDIEPIAADLRPGGDGRRLTRLKLIAGMLGVGLDELVQRDRQRRQRALVAITVGSLAGMLVMASLAMAALLSRNEARRQRSQAEGLIEFMLTDLRQKLEPSGRLDAMDGVGREALKYYRVQRPESLDASALARQARALRLMGEIRVQRGDLSDALVNFEQAAEATNEILVRNPDDGRNIFNHAQNIFWVGDIARQRGQYQEAERSFQEYLRLSKLLTASDPQNDGWRAEVAYATSALGILFLDEGRSSEAVASFERSLAVDADLAQRQSNDLGTQVNLGQGHAWLADALEKQGRLAAARAHRETELKIYESVLSADPTFRQAKFSLIVSRQTLGRLVMLAGDKSGALEEFTDAVSRAEDLLATERDNMDLTAVVAIAHIQRGEVLLASNQLAAARTAQARADELLQAALAHDKTVELWREYQHRSLQLQAAIAARSHDFDRALRLDESVLHELLIGAAPKLNTEPFWLLARSRLQTGDDLAAVGRINEAREQWSALVQSLSEPISNIEPKLLVVLASADNRLGHTADAAAVSQRVVSLAIGG